MVASSRKGAARTVGTERASGGAHLWAPPPQPPSRSTFFFVDRGGVCRDVPQTHRTEASWDLCLRRMFRIDCNNLGPIDCGHPLLVRESHYSPSTNPWMATLEVPPPSLGAVRYSGSDVLGRILGGEVLACPDLHCELVFQHFFELTLREMIHWTAKRDHNAALFESQRERVRAVSTKIYLAYRDRSHSTAPVPFVFASLISDKRANAPGMLIGGQLDTEHAWPLGGAALRKMQVLLNNFGLDSELPELARSEEMDSTFGQEFPVACWVPHFDHVCPDGTLVPGTQEPVLVPLLRGTRLWAEVSPWLSLRDPGTLNAIRSDKALSAWCIANLGAHCLGGSAPTSSVASSTPTTKQLNANPHHHTEDATGARPTCPTDHSTAPTTRCGGGVEEEDARTKRTMELESTLKSELETLRRDVAKLHTRNRELEATVKMGNLVVTSKRTDVYFTESGPTRQTVVLHAPTGRMTIGDYHACRGCLKIIYSQEASGAIDAKLKK